MIQDDTTFILACKDFFGFLAMYCPHGYGECQQGCAYPGRCGRFRQAALNYNRHPARGNESHEQSRRARQGVREPQ